MSATWYKQIKKSTKKLLSYKIHFMHSMNGTLNASAEKAVKSNSIAKTHQVHTYTKFVHCNNDDDFWV